MQRADLLIALGSPLRRPGDRQGVGLRPRGQGHPRRHRPGRDRQGPPARRRRSWATAGSSSRQIIAALSAASARSAPTDGRHLGAAGRAPDPPGWQAEFPLTYDAGRAAGRSSPQYVIEQLARQRRPTTRSSSPASASTRCGRRSSGSSTHPYTWVNSGGLGTMGFAVPAAIGAKVGPARPDGLGHRRRRLLPDDRPGARHRRGRAHPGEDRDPQQRLPGHGAPVAGDVLRRALLRGLPLARPARLREVGRGHGLRRPRASSRPRRWPPAIEKANAINDRPVVIDFRTDACEKVYPDGARRRAQRRHHRRATPSGEGGR